LEPISAIYSRNIRSKRDGLRGIAPGDNKVRKLSCLPADAQAKDCDTVPAAGEAAALFADDLPNA